MRPKACCYGKSDRKCHIDLLIICFTILCFGLEFGIAFLYPDILIVSSVKGQSQELEEHVYASCKNPGHFALTFDDGPAPGTTDTLLDVLKNYNVTATFFVNGQTYSNLNEASGQAVIQRIRNEGHELGVHTWNHRYLLDHWRTIQEVRNEIQSVKEKLYELIGQNVTIMRPPYGAYNQTTIDIAHDEYGLDFVMWNINTLDWSHPGNTSAGMLNYIESTNGTSADTHSFIALHHDPLIGSAELAEAAIEFMLNLNYTFVNVSQCIYG